MSQRSIEVQSRFLDPGGARVARGLRRRDGRTQLAADVYRLRQLPEPGGPAVGRPDPDRGSESWAGQRTRISRRHARSDQPPTGANHPRGSQNRAPLQERNPRQFRWFVTSQGVLGEMFLAIEPGSSDRPLLTDEATVTGISPPRLDLLLSEATSFCTRLTSASPTTSKRSARPSTACTAPCKPVVSSSSTIRASSITSSKMWIRCLAPQRDAQGGPRALRG